MSTNRITTSQRISDHLEKRKYWRRFVSVTYIIFYLIYLFWRSTILDQDSLTLSLFYLLAEIIGFILILSTIIKSWNHNHRSPLPLIHGLSVDVFIPTYNENADLIRRTLMAAKEIDYPHNTWVLDDGKRPEIKKIAAELGINYLSRPQNLNAKAGNLNYGLQHSKADFIMVFDADHIAMPHALKSTLGFFINEKVAMVQTPQSYYNTDSFQHMSSKKTGAIWHDQSYFFNIVQPCHDASNITYCSGSGVIYRRKILDEIGGFPTATVTEDVHTSLKIHKLGYQTFYLNEPIAYGVAAADLAEYHKTRRRWGHGNIHAGKEEKVLSFKEFVLFPLLNQALNLKASLRKSIKIGAQRRVLKNSIASFKSGNGLTFYDRLMYACHLLNYLGGWQQVILFSVPIITLIFGLPAFEISVFNVLVILAFPFLSYLMISEMSCGLARFWPNEVFSMIRWPIHILVSIALFGKKLKWITSSKNIKGRVNWKLMSPQLIVLTVSIVALLMAFFRLGNNFEFGPLFLFFKAKILLTTGYEADYIPIDIHGKMGHGYTIDLVFIAGLWTIYNIFRVISFIRKVICDSKNSHEFFRFQITLPIAIDEDKKIYGQTLEISEESLIYVDGGNSRNYKIGERKEIKLYLPTKILALEIEIEKISGNDIEGKIIWNSVNDRDDLARSIYSIDWHREFLNSTSNFTAPSDLLIKLLTLRIFSVKKSNLQNAFLYQEKPGVIGNFSKKNSASIVVFEELEIGTILNGLKFGKSEVQKVTMKVLKKEALSSLLEKGLDGSISRKYAVFVSENLL